jgi:demethylmenaquinone methyltransferase / 2-methoxy-6-polyprenyl-1,4-benzoquinol methylase
MSDERTTAAGGMETSYGFRHVSEGEKQGLVNEVFHRVAGRYDLMNDLMSGGLHRLWKDALVAWLNPPRRRDWKLLDVAGGTGDIAFRVVEASALNAHATVLDINGSMLQVGRERAAKRGLAGNVDFVEANAEELPFESNSFDAYTIAFGIRNVPRISSSRWRKRIVC